MVHKTIIVAMMVIFVILSASTASPSVNGTNTAATQSTKSDTYVIHEKRKNLPRHWKKRDRMPGNVIVPICIALAQRNVENAEKLLWDVSDPQSSKFARYLSSAQIARVFAPSSKTRSAVLGWLQNFGIKSTDIQTSASRGWLCFNRTVAEAERLLMTEYYVYEHKSGKRHCATEEYSVPFDVQKDIDIITPTVHFDVKVRRSGTQREHLKQRSRQNTVSSVVTDIASPANYKAMRDVSHCNINITLKCLKTLYNFADYKQKASKRNSYGIVEYTPQSYVQSDLDLFLNRYKPSAKNVKPIIDLIDGAVFDTKDAGQLSISGESNLDLQYAIGLVHPTPVTLYQTGDPVEAVMPVVNFTQFPNFDIFNNFLDAIDGSYCTFDGGDDPNYDAIYPDPYKNITGAYEGPEDCGTYKPPYVISTSYSYNEADVTPAYERRQCMEYLKLALRGITVLYSSGDFGVAGTDMNCIDPASGEETQGSLGTKFNPTFPGTCPYITSVGATQINPNSTVYDPESAWEQTIDENLHEHSSGGFSNVFHLPRYQRDAVKSFLALHKPSYNSNQYNNSGEVRGYPDISANGRNYVIALGGNFTLVYGTSAASPVVGSIITLINDARLAIGKRSVGFINPVLYRYHHTLNDITSGNNPGCGTPGFYAVKGWDPVTGLGTPNFEKLLKVYLSLP